MVEDVVELLSKGGLEEFSDNFKQQVTKMYLEHLIINLIYFINMLTEQKLIVMLSIIIMIYLIL